MGIQAIFTKAVAMIADAWSKATILQKIQYVATAVTVAVGVKNFRAAKELAAKGQDILATKVTQGEKIPVIYGRRRVGSTVVFLDTADNRSKDLFVVYALSVGEVDQIEGLTIELDGNPITDTKRFRDGFYIGSDKISSGAGSLCTASQIGNINQTSSGVSGTDPTKRYRQVFNLHHGAATQTADPMLTASIASKWTSSHKLNGIAYIAASFEFDSKAMFQGVPQLTVVVKGKKLYDPRKDTTYGGTGSHTFGTASTYEWSDNPSLCLLDYMTNDEYGKGLAAADINMTTFQDAADDCDSLVNTPDFNGTASSLTYSGTSGNNFITIGSGDYEKFKGDGVVTITDSGSTTIINQSEVITTTRYSYYDSTTDDVRVYLNTTLGSSYTNETGTALVKVKRFTTNGVVDTNNNVLENTRDLLANCRGIINYIEGKYELSIEDTASSAFSVTDDHIIAESGINLTYEDKSQKANKVVVEYFNALKGYELDTVTVFHSASPNYKSDDGGEELELKVSFPFIIDPYVAHNMGEAVLGRSRNQTTISFTATPELYKVKVGDVIDVTYTALGFSGKLFRIESMGLTPEGLVNVQAIEYLDIYTWTVPNAENVEGLVDLPQTHAVKAPTGLAFTDSNTSSTGRPFISWNEPTDFPNHEYRVNIVDSSSNQLLNKIVDVEFVDLNYLPVGSNYVASITSINSIGSESDAATLTFSVSTEPVATADVKDSAVTSGKLADGAVTTLKLADDAVTNAKLAVDSIQGDVIAAGSITTTKLADDAVTNAKIAVDAIQGDVIAAGAITTTKLGANAVTTAKLATDAVTSDIIAASAVTTTEISDNAISTAKLIAGSVTTAKIATGAVTANEIAANTITAGEIAAGAVNTSELAANAVTAAKIAANTITASQIAAGTITANEIATDTITAANIAAGAINTSELAANAVTAAKIAANTITASQIAAGTITTTQIAAGTIAASNIAAGTLTSASGVFGAISAGDISTGSLTSTNHSGTGDGSDFSTAGTKINIADGSVSSENFRISSAGDAFFRGQVTAGSGVSTVAIGADSGSNINIFAGATTPDSATFKVDSTGKVTLTSLILKTGGNTYFDENGFTDYAITQILQGTGTTVGSYAYSQSDNSAYATITTTDAVTVDLTASLDMTQILGDNSYSTSALAKAQIPENITIIIEVAEDDNTFGSPLHGSTSSQFTADTTGVFQPDPSDGSGVTSSEYHVSAFGFFGIYTASISPNFGAVDSNSNMSVSLNNVSLSANTTYYFRFRLTTTDTNYDLENNLTIPTATRTLNISAQSGGFVVASGGGSGSGTSADSFQRISVSGQSTIIADATNSNNLTISAGSGIALTTNASTDTLTIAASGSPTFTDLTVTGNLTVQGTTTTLETATLNVEDKNITLNYGSGDTSASANGAGITIQDAVNSTTDATILWNTTSDEFDFSHGITVDGDASIGGTSGGKLTIAGQSINAFATTTEPSLYRTGSGGSDIFATAGNLVIQPRTSAARSVNIATSNNGTSTLKRASFASNGDISFYEDTGTTAKLFWDASTERLGIGTATPLDILHLSRAGASADARLVIDADTGYDAELKFSEGGTTKFTAGYDAATTSFVIGTTNVDTNKRFIINSSGNTTFSGNVTATAFYGDGSNLTGVGGTTINSNADNRVITGSGTANTLNAESGLTYDGSTLAVTGDARISNGTTYEQSTDMLYVGGSGLDSADAAIYLGNHGGGGGYGWRFYYQGTGSGNQNKLIIRSENGGSQVDALSFTQDGSAYFSETISSGAIASEGSSGSNGVLNVAHPNGADYRATTSSTTGAIEIKLPQSWTSTMMSMTVRIYEYTTDESFEVRLAGYNYTGAYWVNTSAYIIGNPTTDRNFNVRFGHDGTKCVIYIGETTSSWTWMHATVTDFQAGFSGATAANWATGWDINVVTTLATNIDTTHSNIELASNHRLVKVGGTTVIDSSRNLTNIGTATFGGLADFDSGITVSVGGSDRFSITGGDVNVVGATDLQIAGSNRRFSFTSGTGTVRTTTANSLILQTNSTTALTLDSSQNATFAGTITATGDINLTSTATTSPAITFNTSSGTDASIDMAIRANGEGLDFYEPEDANKVHMRIVDDSGVNAVYGLRTGTGDGTVRIDASGNLTNIGTISSGAITSTGAITSADFFKATGGNLKFSAGGNHIFNVDLNGKIYPQTHNAVDLGFSSSLAFRNLYLSGTISSGSQIITSDTYTKIYSATNAAGAGLTFSDHAGGSYAQYGNLNYYHADGSSYGSGNAFVFSTTESTLTVLADGKLMFKEGLFLKPATGTGAGTQIIDSSGRVTHKAAGNAWTDHLNLVSSDGTNKWNVLVDNGASNYLRFGWNSNDRINFRTDGTVQCNKLIANNSFSEFFVAGSASSQTIVAVLGSTSLRPTLLFSESTGTTINAGMSIEYDGRGSGATNYMAINDVSGANVFKVYSGGDVHLKSGAKLFFNGTSNYGVGVGGHNYNSVYADTIESGSAGDPLELVYYQGRGVNIGSGASKNLGCNALGVGVADADIRSGYKAHFKSTGDVALLLEADTDNVTETDNPFIRFEQDGSAVATRIGYISGTNDFEFFNEYTSRFYFGTGNANRAELDTSGNWKVTGNVTAYGSVSDIRRKENIEVIPNALDKVAKLDGVTFNFKDNKDTRMTGVIAQQVMEVLPEAVYEHETIEKEQTYAVHYGNMVGLLIEAIKEQQEQIEELKAKLDDITN